MEKVIVLARLLGFTKDERATLKGQFRYVKYLNDKEQLVMIVRNSLVHIWKMNYRGSKGELIIRMKLEKEKTS